MIIDIELNKVSVAASNIAAPIILPEDTLIINFKSDIYNIKTLLVTIKFNGKTKEYKLENNYSIDISDIVKGGVLEIEASAILKGIAIKRWRVPDIIFKESDHNLEAIPELVKLKEDFTAEIKKIHSALAEINKIIKEM